MNPADKTPGELRAMAEALEWIFVAELFGCDDPGAPIHDKIAELAHRDERIAALEADLDAAKQELVRLRGCRADLARVREELSVAQRLHVERDARDEQDAQARLRLLAERDADKLAMKLALALMRGLDGRAAIDFARKEC